LIGTGPRRYCYQYPGCSEYCLKIPKPRKNGYLQQKREVKYYRQLARRNAPTERITRFHGCVEKKLGTGNIYDLIGDNDGSIAKQFIEYLKQYPERKSEYFVMLDVFENYLFENRVIFYDLSLWNILCRKSENGSLEPFIIDGVGDVVAIPILNLSTRLVKQKQQRRWIRMIRKIEKQFDWMTEYKRHYC